MLRRNIFQSSLFNSIFLLLECSYFSILQILGNFLRSVLGEDDSSSSIRYTKIFFHVELDLSIEYLPPNVVFENQAHAVTRTIRILNFFISKFGHVVLSRVSFSLNWILTKNSLLSSSFQVSSGISIIRIEFSVSRQKMTPGIVPSTFHWHQLCNTDRKTFSFFSFSLSGNGNKITNEKRAKQRFQTLCEYRIG